RSARPCPPRGKGRPAWPAPWEPLPSRPPLRLEHHSGRRPRPILPPPCPHLHPVEVRPRPDESRPITLDDVGIPQGERQHPLTEVVALRQLRQRVGRPHRPRGP